MLEQTGHYQRDKNVIQKKVTPEFSVIYKIFKLLPNKLKVLDIACSEGFLVWLARESGFEEVDGIEIDSRRTRRGKKHLKIDLQTGDIFENLDIIKKYDVFVVSRFFHNIGIRKSDVLMREINKKKNFILIIKYKPGLKREDDQPREPLAKKKGLHRFLERYNLAKKSFPQQILVAAKGKYLPMLKELRKHIGEGA